MRRKLIRELKPEKINGRILIANQRVAVGSVKGVEEKSVKDLRKAVERLSSGKMFPVPTYL